ncbi:uncharacterized protein A1O5_04419 [Cladophialophora psammophila CBS 110553]|uniref:Uncharacterized protein n=1 Tax=Cladophialophora psammophila CBS 110553 TaxID=1182543 RepID=W9WVG7_9EURO|nr:uncharacterized protein A1O5_04419 [Cladophialophora psammophila CBS 110553]EXJ71918.1 hypothetical protein A1O5_04419 [Cladophialophora psammophila CBS 110553]
MPSLDEYLLKEPRLNVRSGNSSLDDLPKKFDSQSQSQSQSQPVPPYVLPPKPLKPLRKYCTIRNVLITIGAFLVYSGCTVGAVVPGLIAGYPFYTLLDLYGNRHLAERLFPCDPSLYSGRFAVNIAWGSLSYTTVKILDAGLNLVLGRGSQVLLSWLSYHLFSMAILRIIQENCVPLQLYTAMAFDTTSIKGAWYQLRAVTKVDTVRAKVTLIWLAVAVAYLIALPTLLDLTTGYIVEYKTMVNVTSPGDSTYKLIELDRDQLNSISYDAYCAANGGCIEHYPGEFTKILISGQNMSFKAFVDDDYNWVMQERKELQRHPPMCPQQYLSMGSFQRLSLDRLLGMFAVWMDSFRNGALWRSGRGFGRYRNIIDIAEHLQSHFGQDLCAYTHEELEEKIDRLDPVGIEVLADGEFAHIRLSQNPGGKHLLSTPGLHYGGIERLNNGKVSATWPLRSGDPCKESGCGYYIGAVRGDVH